MHDAQRRRLIEDAGDMIDGHGLPHMVGRVLGALLISVPPRRSIDELAADLQASKGSISAATQLLLRLNLIERISLPGHRRHYYRLRPSVWEDLFRNRREHIEQHRSVAQRALEILRDAPIEAKRQAIEMLAFFEFVAEELPALERAWEARREGIVRRLLEEHA